MAYKIPFSKFVRSRGALFASVGVASTSYALFNTTHLAHAAEDKRTSGVASSSKPSPHTWLNEIDARSKMRTSSSKKGSGWIDALLDDPDVVSISSKGVLNLGSGITLGEDHFFSALMDEGLVNSIDCWYNKKEKLFIGVYSLGEDVCGYPRLVHGGLSAAVADETFGGLVFALKEYGVLPGGPAYTARLELDYARPVPSNTKVVALARIDKLEGRKVWMNCALTGMDGPGQEGAGTFVRARALFVHPKPQVSNPMSWLCLAPWPVSKALFVAANKISGSGNPLLGGSTPRGSRKEDV